MRKIDSLVEIKATNLPDLSILKENDPEYKLIINYVVEISRYEFDHEFGTESGVDYNIGDILILNEDKPTITEADMNRIYKICEREMERSIPYD